jgi:TolB-like protein/Tfp pilus assembly protein PilF
MPFPAISPDYLIESVLGRGGMATVYLATDRRHDRKVAVKVLSPDIAASLGGERFLREIRIAAGLVHPHIVPLIDSGEHDRLLYYVTPYLSGGTLRELLRAQGKLPLAEVIRIAREIGAALDFAHRLGFVHRDVKPENILFADGHAILADFGIARACGPSGTGEGITAGGMAVGTPEYMSPEQAAGEQALGGASDLYSLACVVYEILTGEPPIRGEGGRQTMAMQVSTTPRPVRAVRPELPPRVERALVRALSKDPGERFPTAEDFIRALESEGGSGLVPLAIGRAIAVLPFVNASPDPDNEYLSDGITDELINALAHVDGLRVASRTSGFALKGKPLDVRAIGALLGVAWVLEGTVRRAGDRLRVTAQLSSAEDGRLLWSGRYDRTFADVFAIQEELAHTIVTTLRATSFAELAEPAQKRYTRSVKAYGLYLKGRYAWNKRTQDGITEAIRYFEEAIAEDPAYAPAYTGLADSYSLQLDYRNVAVDEGFARAMSYARQALALDDSLAEAHASLAWALFIHEWDWEESRREFARAIALDPRYATAHQWYAFWHTAHRRFDEALVEAHTALELDPASVAVRRTVGWVYYYARRFEPAREHLTRAIAMNPVAEENYWILGVILSQLEEWQEAERVLREGLTFAELGTYTLATLGYVLARSGRRTEAETILSGLEVRARTEYISPVAFVTIHLGLGNTGAALDWAERVYVERRGWVVYLQVNPMLDSVRQEPRFRALVEKMGFL